MLRHRFDRPVGCRRKKLATQLSSNTRVAKGIGGVRRHERCSAGWMKRSKVSPPNLTVLGHVFHHHTDLRALIRLQPSNSEATSELNALLHPNQSSVQPTKGATAGGSSSSANDEVLNVSKPRSGKPLPFEATEEEKQKLKISNLPLTVDIPSNFEFMAAATAAGGMGGKSASSSGEKGKPKRSGPRGSKEMPLGPGTKKVSGKGQTMSFTYPNWERYLVKKVTD